MKKVLLLFLVAVLIPGVAQAQNTCSSPIAVEIPPESWPFQDLGQTTCGRINDYGDGEGSTCLMNFETGEDIIYRLDVIENVLVDIEYDPKGTEMTGLAISTEECPPGPDCLYFEENWGGEVSTLNNVYLEGGMIYYLMIDSDAMEGPSCIPDFDLTISEASALTGRCCYGNPSSPSCADGETQADCQDRADDISWAEGLNCTDNPCQVSSEGDNCSNPKAVEIPPLEWPYEDFGQTTCGRLNDYGSYSTCLDDYDTGEDIIYRLDVMDNVWVDITLDPLETAMTGIAISSESCPPEHNCMARAISNDGMPVTMETIQLLSGSSYFIIIDSNGESESYCIPEFNLTIDQAAPPTGRCCFGDPAFPDCADGEYFSDCQEREDYIAWAEGLNCADHPCPLPGGDNCEDPVALTSAYLPFVRYLEYATGRGNDYDQTCLGDYDNGEDIIYQFTNDRESAISLSIYINSYLSDWGALIDDTCPPGGSGECIDYFQAGEVESEHTFNGVTVDPGGVIYIMVDDFTGEEAVNFDISITEEINGYEYLPGDANMYNGSWPPAVIGSDVTYLVNFFRGLTANPACLLNDFYAAADVNGSCTVIGSDVTRLVNFFRGQGIIEPCPDYPPAWLTAGDCPEDAPEGWPNCEEQIVITKQKQIPKTVK